MMAYIFAIVIWLCILIGFPFSLYYIYKGLSKWQSEGNRFNLKSLLSEEAIRDAPSLNLIIKGIWVLLVILGIWVWSKI